jgi:hypothetical protein
MTIVLIYSFAKYNEPNLASKTPANFILNFEIGERKKREYLHIKKLL